MVQPFRLPGITAAVLLFAQLSAPGAFVAAGGQRSSHASQPVEFFDSHFHLTNYIQEGTDIRRFVEIMGANVGRSTLFGIPLQQQWSYRSSGDNAPTYYLQTDAPLYYYSFTDAQIALAYKSLPPDQQARLDPMITGFNPTDMYAADHIRRVLTLFPGVFSGIGEFTIHKEFVSDKVAGEVASLMDPALDRILDFAQEAGLLVLLHNDVDVPFPKKGQAPAYLSQLKAVLRRHPGATVIWAHMGVGRVIHPIDAHSRMLEEIIQDPGFSHVYFDISWDEAAKYAVASAETREVISALFNRYPDRFLFGTDAVAPEDQDQYFKTYFAYESLWPLLTKEASQKIRQGNYERLFDEARRRVRAWETRHVPCMSAIPGSC
jgi:hypothetical protein